MKDKIKRLLKQQDMSQNELAELLGLTYQTISIKINGHKDFTLSELRTIKIVFGLTPEMMDYIFFSEDTAE